MVGIKIDKPLETTMTHSNTTGITKDSYITTLNNSVRKAGFQHKYIQIKNEHPFYHWWLLPF